MDKNYTPKIILDLDKHAGGWQQDFDLHNKLRLWIESSIEQFVWPGSLKELEVTVVLTNNSEIAQLNKQYRGKPYPTNVLSFPSYNLIPNDYLEIENYDGYIHLGDIVIAEEIIIAEAEKGGVSFNDHLAHLVVHSVLHLLGYDHEEDEDSELMEAKEVLILESLGIKSPYQTI